MNFFVQNLREVTAKLVKNFDTALLHNLQILPLHQVERIR